MSGQILTKALGLWNKIGLYVAGGLLATTLISSAGWYITDLKLDAAVLARKNDKVTYEKAQADYEAKALLNKITEEAKYNEERKKADIAYDSLLSKYRANLRVYAGSQGSVSGYNLPDYTGSPQSSDGPSTGAVVPVEGSRSSPPRASNFLLIPMEDADICAINTARVIVTQQWYDSVKGGDNE